MRATKIKPYQPEYRVKAQDALHDRIQLTLGEWKVTGECPLDDHEDGKTTPANEAVIDFTNYLGTPPKDQRAGPEANLFGLVFNRPSGNKPSRRFLKVRKREAQLGHPSRDVPPPMFTGTMEMLARPGIKGGSSFELTAELHLKLNPTLHERQQRQRPKPARQGLQPHGELFLREMPNEEGGEWSLDGKDNFLPKNASGEVTWKPAETLPKLARFVDEVWKRTRHELKRTKDGRDTGTPGMYEFLVSKKEGTLHQAETYFEVFHPEPLRFVESIEPRARSFANKVSATRFQVKKKKRGLRFQVGNEQQSLSLFIELRKGVALRIYAKTNQRVRFEIQHRLDKANRPLQGEQSFDGIEALVDLLSTLREDAASLVNDFLDELNSSEGHPSTARAPLMLVTEISNAAQDYGKTASILEALCVNGRLVLSDNSPLRQAIMRLIERRVLVNRHRSSTYKLAPTWREAGRILAQEGRLSLLIDTPALSRARQARQSTPAPARRPRSRVF